MLNNYFIASLTVIEMDSLKDLILKEIARYPSKHINASSFERAIKLLPLNDQNVRVGQDKIVQHIINHVISAGRLTDDIISISMLDAYCTSISLKNSKITSDYVMKVSFQCIHLESLILDGCLQVDDISIQTVLQNCKRMQNLSINNCRKVTDATLVSYKRAIEQGYHIKSLCVGGNFNITTAGLESFFRGSAHPVALRSITTVNLSGLALSELVLRLLLQFCPYVTHLGLSYTCSTVLHEAALGTVLRSYSRTLEQLDIAWLGCNTRSNIHMSGSTLMMTELSENLLLTLVQQCGRLRSLDLCGMKCFSIPMIQRMVETRAALVDTPLPPDPSPTAGAGAGGDAGGVYVPLVYLNVKYILNVANTTASVQLDNMVANNPHIRFVI